MISEKYQRQVAAYKQISLQCSINQYSIVDYVCVVVRWMLIQLKLATPTYVECIVIGPPLYVMSLQLCFSIGPFDTEACRFQEDTTNTQGIIITTSGGLLE